jgi:hypothetical protein
MNERSAGSNRKIRDYAEEKLKNFSAISPDLAGQTPEALIHELRVHQIELETQAEEIKRSHLALEVSRDR